MVLLVISLWSRVISVEMISRMEKGYGGVPAIPICFYLGTVSKTIDHMYI